MVRVLNTLRPRQNGYLFADDIFKRIFFNENIWILIQISMKSVPKDPINNIPALVQIMAWRRPGDKPLSGPMMVRLPTHICVTRPQWVNHWQCMCHRMLETLSNITFIYLPGVTAVGDTNKISRWFNIPRRVTLTPRALFTNMVSL